MLRSGCTTRITRFVSTTIPQKLATDAATFRGFFPNSGAGQFTYLEAIQLYGADYQLREPRKTFRLTVSTTF